LTGRESTTNWWGGDLVRMTKVFRMEIEVWTRGKGDGGLSIGKIETKTRFIINKTGDPLQTIGEDGKGR